MEPVNRFFNTHKLAGFIIIIILSGFLTALLVLRSELMLTTAAGFSDPIDHHKYIYMAQHPFGFFIAPFCWRIGLPLLAGALPFSLQTSFLSITFLAMVFSGAALFYLLHRLGFDSFYSLCGLLLLYAAGWIVRVSLINFWVPNALILLTILLCLYLIAARKDWWFMALLAAGVLIKESAFFVVPVYYTFTCRKLIDWRAAKRTILLALPAITIFLLLRFALLPAQNDNIQYVSSLPFSLTQVQQGTVDYNYLTLLKTIAVERLENISVRELMDLSLYPFGALLCLLPFFAIRQNLKWLAKFWPYLLLVYSQLLFAVSTIKLLFLALPVLIILAVEGLKSISQRFKVPAAIVLLLPTVTYFVNLTKPDDNADFKWLALVFALWFAMVFILARLPHKATLTDPVR